MVSVGATLAMLVLGQTPAPVLPSTQRLLAQAVKSSSVRLTAVTLIEGKLAEREYKMAWDKGRVTVFFGEKVVALGDRTGITFSPDGQSPQIKRPYKTLMLTGKPEDIFLGFIMGSRHGNGIRGQLTPYPSSQWYVPVEPLMPIVVEAMPERIVIGGNQNPSVRASRLALVIDPADKTRISEIAFDEWIGLGGNRWGEGSQSRVHAVIEYPEPPTPAGADGGIG